MLKVKAILSPNQLRYGLQNIEGFSQLSPLGPGIELTDPESGRTREITVTFTRTKNTGVLVVLINVYSPVLKDQIIPHDGHSAVYMSFYNHPNEIDSRLETFIDALQACFIYDSSKDILVHKVAMMDHILSTDIAHVVI
ncbi:hypothetical protein D3C81_237520 [compost metagenome]